jgi:hypothetical protein
MSLIGTLSFAFVALYFIYFEPSRSPSELMTPEAIEKLFSDYMLLGLTDIVVCGGGSFCTLAAMHTNRPMLVYPARPPANLSLCLENSLIVGPERHVAHDGSPCACASANHSTKGVFIYSV